MALSEALAAHLAEGVTTLARCWAVTRKDGTTYGFTDHDMPLSFEGVVFRANSGLSAQALQQTTGLSVDNTEAVGALSDASLTEADIQAGRFDGAEVRAWLVNWTDVDNRVLQFRGTLGEVRRGGGAFQAELRGLTEALNQPQGRVFQQPCAAVLGDAQCGFDFDAVPGYVAERAVEEIAEGKFLSFGSFDGFDERWFERGRLQVLSGAAAGLTALVKNDRYQDTTRVIEVWEAFRTELLPGDMVRIEAGCDKRAETCRLKFNNFNNFRGFPHIPGEDWLTAYPVSSGVNDGGSLSS